MVDYLVCLILEFLDSKIALHYMELRNVGDHGLIKGYDPEEVSVLV